MTALGDCLSWYLNHHWSKTELSKGLYMILVMNSVLRVSPSKRFVNLIQSHCKRKCCLGTTIVRAHAKVEGFFSPLWCIELKLLKTILKYIFRQEMLLSCMVIQSENNPWNEIFCWLPVFVMLLRQCVYDDSELMSGEICCKLLMISGRINLCPLSFPFRMNKKYVMWALGPDSGMAADLLEEKGKDSRFIYSLTFMWNLFITDTLYYRHRYNDRLLKKYSKMKIFLPMF